MVIHSQGRAQGVGSVATGAVVPSLKNLNVKSKFPGTTEKHYLKQSPTLTHSHTGTGWKRLGWQRFRVDHKLTEIINNESQAQTIRWKFTRLQMKEPLCSPG